MDDDRSLSIGKRLLTKLPDSCRSNTVVLNSALHMLMHRGELVEGEKLFAQMNKDQSSYGTMMSGSSLFSNTKTFCTHPFCRLSSSTRARKSSGNISTDIEVESSALFAPVQSLRSVT
jgi:hypothetical protein